MSNFLRVGDRKHRDLGRRKAKKHVKEFYKILHELDDVAKEMVLHEEEVDENNIEEITSNYTDRTIDTFEKTILLSKIHNLKVEDE